jgi:hypothetical protein
MSDAIEQVDDIDSAKNTSAIVSEEPSPTTLATRGVCFYNDRKYSKGAIICSAGRRLVCQFDGSWWNRGSC